MHDFLTIILAILTLTLLFISVALYRRQHPGGIFRNSAAPKMTGWSNEEFKKLSEVTAWKEAEAKLLKRNRLYFFIIQMNQAIVKAKEEVNLFKEACRIAVEAGEFRMAWIGMLDENHTRLIPVTHAGEEAEYLSKISVISIAGPPESMGPGGNALREGRYFVCNDIESAPEMAPWREAALGRNYRSSIGLPLKRGNKVVGLFSLYADKKDFFDAEEIALLDDIAADISFVLESYTQEAMGRKAEEEILNRERRFRSLIENSTDGLSVIGADGTVLDISPSGEKILSFSRDEVIGKIPKDIVHPEDIWLVATTFRDILDNPGHIPTIQYRLVIPGGGFRWIECSYKNLLHEPYINAIVLNYRDVTDQVIAKNAIINERNLSDTIINSLPGIFYLYTEAGQFLRWNGSFEEVTGYSSDEIRQMHPLDFFDTDEKELLTQKIGNVFLSGEDHVQANFLLKTGAKIPYYFTGKVITYEGKKCLLGVGIDFSDRVQAQEKIKETTEQLRQLAAHLQNIREEERLGIARDIHDDLGQQLTVVKMAMVRLARQMGGNEAIEKNFQVVIDMIGKGIESIRRISTQLRPGILDDLGLVEAMKWQIEEFEKRFSISVSARFPENPDVISPAISINLFRIFQETLTNIARHAETTDVEVMLHADNQHLYLKVKDNGKGFNASEIRSKRTLGLLGMKERALMIGGQFAMDSRPGQGTTIEIEIPYNRP